MCEAEKGEENTILLIFEEVNKHRKLRYELNNGGKDA